MSSTCLAVGKPTQRITLTERGDKGEGSGEEEREGRRVGRGWGLGGRERGEGNGEEERERGENYKQIG